METIELSKDWRLEKPSKDSVWYLVDMRDEIKAIPFPALKVTKVNRKDKGKLLKQLLEMNELLGQTDIIHQVFPPPKEGKIELPCNGCAYQDKKPSESPCKNCIERESQKAGMPLQKIINDSR